MAYIPKLGGSTPTEFESQFQKSSISLISYSSTLIEQLANDDSGLVISHGSGCFWRHNDIVHLLTARHVLTGRSPFDNSLMSKTGFIPRKLRVHPMLKIASDKSVRASTEVEVPESDSLLQDPGFEKLRTDIAALPLMNDVMKQVYCLNDDPSIFEEVFTHVGMDCAVVGYPTRHFGDLMMPIWRKGSIASEPLLPVDGKPMFLLDASTSPGFSGAPVFRRHYGPLPKTHEDGSLTVLSDRVMTTSFVGIYAGRLEHRHFGGEVPFVFYANRIPKMFGE